MFSLPFNVLRLSHELAGIHIVHLALLVMLFCMAGCGPQPTAPPPKNPVFTERVDYTPKPTPNVPVVEMGIAELLTEETPLLQLTLPTGLRAGNIIAFEGTIVHPDKRMTGGSLLTQLTFKSGNDTVIANEAGARCEGKDGRLSYRFELRFLKGPVREHTLTVTFSGLPPGQKADKPPGKWSVPIVNQALNLDE